VRILAAALLTCATLAAQGEALRATLDRLSGPDKLQGISAAVIKPDGTIIAAASGLADREAKIPMRPADRMLAGSVGKMFVSAVILLAIQDGALKLDDPVKRWLGDQPWYARVPNANDITLRMLMTHSSGIPEHVLDKQFIAAMHADPDKIWKPEELVSYILDKPALFPAGRDWSYADTNYILAAMMFEKATGRRYYDDLRRRILTPFALKDTIPSDRRVLPGVVPGYSNPRGPFGIPGRTMKGNEQILNPQMEWTGGGVASTPSDLARWAKLLYEGKVLNEASMKELTTGVDASHGRGGSKNERYGLAVQMRPSKWGMTWGHDGWYPGYLTTVLYWPDKHTAIVVQVNTDDQRELKMPIGKLMEEIATSVF
jgi:D-alanyl-D-alanine carboxypeptidase